MDHDKNPRRPSLRGGWIHEYEPDKPEWLSNPDAGYEYKDLYTTASCCQLKKRWPREERHQNELVADVGFRLVS